VHVDGTFLFVHVEVVTYDPAWSTEFEVLRQTLAQALAGVPVVGIEHVGSTAVPGLAAKPVIDIDIIVSEEYVGSAIAALAGIGHTSLGEMGVPARYALEAPDDIVRRNIYVTVDGCLSRCLSLRNHLAVRGVLRNDERLRDAYGALKLRLAEHDFSSIDEYVAAKSDLLQVILERGGIDSADRAEIRGINDPDG
jgi:GrpB-like predicted nucleotidyltransferase (UPF0157 family)